MTQCGGLVCMHSLSLIENCPHQYATADVSESKDKFPQPWPHAVTISAVLSVTRAKEHC